VSWLLHCRAYVSIKYSVLQDCTKLAQSTAPESTNAMRQLDLAKTRRFTFLKSGTCSNSLECLNHRAAPIDNRSENIKNKSTDFMHVQCLRRLWGVWSEIRHCWGLINESKKRSPDCTICHVVTGYLARSKRCRISLQASRAEWMRQGLGPCDRKCSRPTSHRTASSHRTAPSKQTANIITLYQSYYTFIRVGC